MKGSSEMFNLTLSFSLILSIATATDSPAMSFLLTIRLPSPGFIGSSPTKSRFSGDRLCVTEVSSGEIALHIMVRCISPPDTQSRHLLRTSTPKPTRAPPRATLHSSYAKRFGQADGRIGDIRTKRKQNN